VFTVSDVIHIMKSKFLVKYDRSDNLHANCAQNCNEIVRHTVTRVHSSVMFSSHVLYNKCIVALQDISYINQVIYM